MIISRVYKYRAYPSKAQVSALENQFSMCRHLYNRLLGERIDAYSTEKKSIGYYVQKRGLVDFKKERPWYKGVHSQVLQDVVQRLDRAYQNFFRRVEAGDVPGFPKFKKRGQWTSICYPQYSESPTNLVRVPKIGIVKVKVHRAMLDGAKVKRLTIEKDGDKWFFCFSFETCLEAEPKQGLSAVGIDMGVVDLFYDSDGNSVQAPRFYRKLRKKLSRLQARLAKTEKRSVAWYKFLRAIQKVYYKIKCLRLDFIHNAVNDLLAKHDVIVMEDLRIKNMTRRPKPVQDEAGNYIPNGACRKAGLNTSILDACWGIFRSILEYKARDKGKTVVLVPAAYTSQTCPECGAVVKKALSNRTHLCGSCGYTTHRDHAAAQVILRIGLDTLAAQAA